jgi:class 3 adenylate cyclase
VGYFRAKGARTRRLASYLKKRARARPASRKALDAKNRSRLVTRRAVVFTDTDDFTLLVARHGIVHFLMLFDRAVARLEAVVKRQRGRLLKVEGDSLLLTFPDAAHACRGVLAIQAALGRLNRGRPRNERLAFSYGLGYGDVLEVERDVFGLEVNLASKLGEDRARRDEALLTPAAAEGLPPALARRLRPHSVARFEGRAIAIRRLALG